MSARADALAVEVASADDDEAIQRLLGATPVPGRVALSFERAPSYFLGCPAMGHDYRVFVIRHQASGELIGMLTHAVRLRYVNGVARPVGYFTHIRVDPRFRTRWVLPLFSRPVVRRLAELDVVGHFGIIAEETSASTTILADRPRGIIPGFRPLTRLRSLGLVVLWPRPMRRTPFRLEPGCAADVPEIVACLNRHGAAKQFFPVYSEADFLPGSLSTFGFRVEDFIIARREGEVIGVVGLWDRSASKQTVVRGYTRPIKWLRPPYNLAARPLRLPRLPGPGEALKCAYAAFIAVEDNDPNLFSALLRSLYNRAAAHGYAYLIVDLAEQDPLLQVARGYPHIAYHRRLYTVRWESEGGVLERLGGRIPYVDTAAL